MKTRKRGTTLLEVTVGAAFTVIVLLGAMSTFLSGSIGWIRGAGKIDAESGSQRAVRAVSRELREAMSVIVDPDGLGVTYRLPVKDDSGSYVMPITWDGVTRRIQLTNGDLQVVDGTSTKRLCKKIILTDPQTPGGTGSYKIFTAGAGTITRSLAVMVVTRENTDYNKTATSRSRETVFLRNIPQLVK